MVSGTEFRVGVFEAGEETRIHGVGLDPRGVSGDDIEVYREFFRDFIPENGLEDYLSALASPGLSNPSGL